MSQSLVQVYIHLIFSTKNRVHFLHPDIRADLCSYMGGILRNLESPAISIGCVSDHIHILYSHSKHLTLIKLLEEIKTESSKWAKTKGDEFANFYWQKGYGAFSVSSSRVQAVKRYIENQEKHHRRVTFQDELRQFFKEYGLVWDEKYVWD
ncbi:MAG: IS200/IS605 family transposase [Candidatus Sumerlaeia bacterium]